MGNSHWRTEKQTAPFVCGNGRTERINCYVSTWQRRCYTDELPDEVPHKLMMANRAPSYKAAALALLKNDHGMLSLGFSAPTSKWYHLLKQQSGGNMLTALKAIARSNGKSAHVYDGQIQATNGHLTINSPCTSLASHAFTVATGKLIAAVNLCGGSPNVKLTPTKLSLSKKETKVFLPLMDHAAYPKMLLEGQSALIDGEVLLTALSVLSKFISDDASRPWACSVLIKNGAAYATNNIAAVKSTVKNIPDHIIPAFLVKELLHMKESPTSIVLSEKAVIYQYANGLWIRGALPVYDWPDMAPFFADVSDCPLIEKTMLDNVTALLKLSSAVKTQEIIFADECIKLSDKDTDASIVNKGLPDNRFNAVLLVNVLEVADRADFSRTKVPFTGANVRGIMMSRPL